MRTVLVGNRALAKHALRHMLQTGWNVVGIVSPKAASEMARGQAGFEPVGDIAAQHGLTHIETTDINDEETTTALANLDPDLCLCPGWSQIIEEQVLEIPSEGFVGFHSSNLPRGRGGAPVNWSIIHGQDRLWLSMFSYTSGIDAGDVIRQQAVPIEHRDDVATVLDKLAVASFDILDDVRDQFEDGTVDPSPQDLGDAAYRPRRQPQDGLVDWRWPADRIYDWVRAQTRPYPGAYSFLDGDNIRIWRARPQEGTTDREPGEITAVVEREGIDVATGDGLLRLTRVQRNDGPQLWADTLAERCDITPGQRLSTSQAPPDWLYTGIRDDAGGTQYTTNLTVGESGTVTAVVRSPNDSRSVRVVGTLDGETVRDRTLSVEGKSELPVEYRPTETGTHSVKIQFHDEGVVDTRYLKVFVTN
jgi:methionyl-tRNA formyltransferase